MPIARFGCQLVLALLCVAGGTVWLRHAAAPSVSGIPVAAALPRVVKLASVEWPPYTGKRLPGNGATAMVLRTALEAAGMELHLEFMPWARVLETVRKDGSFAGFFPEYQAPEREAQFLYSEPLGVSTLGFIERTGHPVAWETLEDLAGTPIGVVQGYVNTREFDILATEGRLRTEAVSDDLTNIRKVAMGRLPLAIIDPLVLRYLLQSEAAAIAMGGKVRVQARLLEQKSLHVCFRIGPEGESLRQVLNAALAGRDVLAEQEAALAVIFPHPAKN